MKTKIKAFILTISDSRQPHDDASGDEIARLLTEYGAEIVDRRIVTDDLMEIRETLASVVQRNETNLILTTGGTGFGPRDNTPEATRAIIEREAPGIAEALRRETASKTPMAMLSRGVAGIRGETLIINFPGSPRAVVECFEVLRPVLNHAIDLIRGKTSH